jgi:hypothetical protein
MIDMTFGDGDFHLARFSDSPGTEKPRNPG